LRHREQSEAIQTWGLRRRPSLDRVAVARDDGGAIRGICVCAVGSLFAGLHGSSTPPAVAV
jgi:hypothetical protein